MKRKSNMKELGIIALGVLVVACVGYAIYHFLKAILAAIIALILVFGLSVYEAHMYNDGICPECEVELEAIDVASNGQIIWYCENCHYKCYYK